MSTPTIMFDHVRGVVRIDPAGVPYATGTTSALCPDLLDSSKIGEADTLRGRVVRAFMRLMDHWPKPTSRG